MNNDEMKSSNNCLGLGDLRKHVRMSGEMNNCLGFGSLGEGRTQSQVRDGVNILTPEASFIFVNGNG